MEACPFLPLAPLFPETRIRGVISSNPNHPLVHSNIILERNARSYKIGAARQDKAETNGGM